MLSMRAAVKWWERFDLKKFGAFVRSARGGAHSTIKS